MTGVAVSVLALLVTSAGEAVVAEEQHGAVGSRSLHSGEAEEALEDVHQARHGGYFGDADDLYHYEVLLEQRRVILYVNDELNRPLDVRPLDGRWVLNPDVPAPVTGAFQPEDSGRYFFADLPLAEGAASAHLKVEVLKDGVWAGLEFVLPRS